MYGWDIHLSISILWKLGITNVMSLMFVRIKVNIRKKKILIPAGELFVTLTLLKINPSLTFTFIFTQADKIKRNFISFSQKCSFWSPFWTILRFTASFVHRQRESHQSFPSGKIQTLFWMTYQCNPGLKMSVSLICTKFFSSREEIRIVPIS